MKNDPNEILTTYTHRHSLISKNRTYYIGSHALSWRDDSESEISLDYNDIQKVEAQFAPSRVQSNRYLLRLISKQKRKTDITNTTYKGIGDFEELNQTYIPFVTQLHRIITEKNPNTLFTKGSSKAGYIFSIFMLIILFVISVVAFLFFLISGVIWVAAIKLMIIILLLPRLIRYIKRNKPGSYDPLNLPADILPN